jgi:hypothetical protein
MWLSLAPSRLVQILQTFWPLKWNRWNPSGGRSGPPVFAATQPHDRNLMPFQFFEIQEAIVRRFHRLLIITVTTPGSVRAWRVERHAENDARAAEASRPDRPLAPSCAKHPKSFDPVARGTVDGCLWPNHSAEWGHRMRAEDKGGRREALNGPRGTACMLQPPPNHGQRNAQPCSRPPS